MDELGGVRSRRPSAVRGRPRPDPGAIVRLGRGALRWTTWRADAGVAVIGPLAGVTLPDEDLVGHTVASLAGRGYHEVITTALGPGERAPFVAAGFTEREQLHLLAHDLGALPPPRPGVAVRRPHRRDWETMGAIDADAFTTANLAHPFWHLDAIGIADAAAATPSSRVRVATTGRPGIDGYTVTGRAGRRGFVQRVAVDPGAQRRGVATTLVADGLAWLARRGAEQAWVNTQLGNDGALRLYLALGFTLLPDRLTVLTHPLEPGP